MRIHPLSYNGNLLDSKLEGFLDAAESGVYLNQHAVVLLFEVTIWRSERVRTVGG